MKREYLPGWFLLLLVGVIATLISNTVTVAGKHPLEASAAAVLIGLLLRNTGRLPALFLPGITTSDKLLIAGVVLLGTSLNIREFFAHGGSFLAVTMGTMIVGLAGTWGLARMSKLSTPLGLLLSIGTCICGTSAIAVVAPIIRSREEETGYAVATVATCGLVALLLYPFVASLTGMNEVTFGVFAGTAIHSTPQVVGAGYMVSDLAGRTATAIKLLRNCFIVPAAFIIAIWWQRKQAAELSSQEVGVTRGFPWFLFGYFLMSGLASEGFFSPKGISWFTEAGKFMVLLAMGGVGLSCSVTALRSLGIRPFLVGIGGSVIVAVASLLLITFFSIG